MILLADCYAKGLGVSMNSAEAVKWWSKAAKQSGSADEKTLNCFIDSWGIVTKGEDSKAETFVGDCYANGDGVFQNKVEAKQWYLKAAERGFPEAQRKMALNSSPKKQLNGVSEVAEWFIKAANNGDAESQTTLGRLYQMGYCVTENHREAARYFQISVPVQPGNSGGALVDERGNVVGVVAPLILHRQPKLPDIR
jgi:hypothetical protein